MTRPTSPNAESWCVIDYDGKVLPGTWPTEQEATDKGLCGRYLLSGADVVLAPNGHYQEQDTTRNPLTLSEGHLIAYLSVAVSNALNHLERCEPNDAEDWLRLAKRALGDD